MARLSTNWIIEPIFDYEYKTYQALSYTSQAHRHFDEGKLFPYLSDLRKHIDILTHYQSSVIGLENEIRTELIGLDPTKAALIYEKPPDDEVTDFLKEILSFALEKFYPVYRRGMEEKEEVIQRMRISPVGLLQPDGWGGLLFLEKSRTTRIYEYRYRFIRRPNRNEAYKDVQTNFIDELETGMFPDYRHLKLEYLKMMGLENELNTYLVETESEIPTFETLIPVVKEHLIQLAS